MGRIIDITFNEKPYIIEYDRYSVVKFMETQKGDISKANIDTAIDLVYCGLLKHHSSDMPSREVILDLLLAMGDKLELFTNELSKCIEEVTTSLKATQEAGNLKWGVRK